MPIKKYTKGSRKKSFEARKKIRKKARKGGGLALMVGPLKTICGFPKWCLLPKETKLKEKNPYLGTSLKSSKKSLSYSKKSPIFLHAYATFSEY